MAKPTTKIRDDGLRYQSKVGGALFFQGGSSTMSCYLCGTRRERNTMTPRVLIGKTQFVCAPSCKAAKEADAALKQAAAQA